MKKQGKKILAVALTLALVLVAVLVIAPWDGATTPAGADTPATATPVEGSASADGVKDTNINTLDLEDDTAGGSDDAEEGEDQVSSLIPSAGIPEIKEKLSWEAIQNFPIKRSDMTVDEMRSLCIDFLNYSKQALWTPSDDVKFIRNASGSPDTMSRGIVYGGFPYVGVASGSVYRMISFMDENGVVDMKKALNVTDLSKQLPVEQLKYFGNQCSIGAWWGWARVINSADYLWTQNVNSSNNFVPLGDLKDYGSDWSYKVNLTKNNNTTTFCDTNGATTMYEAYALLQKADCMVYFTTAGHVIMAATDAVVVRDGDGNIDGENSYVYITDQAQSWKDGENAAGDKFKYKNSVNAKKTFAELFAGKYVPYTFKEFQGTDPVEDTVCTISHVGDTITKSQLFESVVTTNYSISDIYAIVTDDSGNEIYRHMVMSPSAGRQEQQIIETNEGRKIENQNVRSWGTLPESGNYRIEIQVQLGTGERPTVYVGTLVL